MESYKCWGYKDRPGKRQPWARSRQNSILKCQFRRLFPAQRHHNFLVASDQDNVAVFDRLDRYLMNGAADLQSELLTFAHDSAIDDGVTSFRIENDCRNDEGRSRNSGSGVLIFGQFGGGFPSNRPKWITLS